MPTYDYQCQACEHQFEAFQKMSDPHLENCPKCQGKVKRLISGGAGLIFKGSGFYITDYKNKDRQKKETKPVSKPGEKKGEAKKESTKESKDQTKKNK